MYPISIITINYNEADKLERTIKSIINQTTNNFEYIVIDGGSKDRSKQIIEKYSEYINYWVSEHDNGIYNAMNKGIKASKGQYLLFLNSGDELYNRTTIQNALTHLQCDDIISFSVNIVTNNNNIITYKHPEQPSFFYLCKNSLKHQSTFIKKELFYKIGFYDENKKIVSDWSFFLLALCKYNFSYKCVNIILSNFYSDGISNNVEYKALIHKEAEATLTQYFPHYYIDYLLYNKMLNADTHIYVERSKKRLLRKIQSFLGILIQKLNHL